MGTAQTCYLPDAWGRHTSKKIRLSLYALNMHTYLYGIGIKYRETIMRTTLNIEDALVARASQLTGVKEKTSLVRLGLEALIALESAKRLAKLGGTEKALRMPPRRRPGD
jgi:Arc/MetJ family transcription regulator